MTALAPTHFKSTNALTTKLGVGGRKYTVLYCIGLQISTNFESAENILIATYPSPFPYYAPFGAFCKDRGKKSTIAAIAIGVETGSGANLLSVLQFISCAAFLGARNR
jgi:hypothetical protein